MAGMKLVPVLFGLLALVGQLQTAGAADSDGGGLPTVSDAEISKVIEEAKKKIKEELDANSLVKLGGPESKPSPGSAGAFLISSADVTRAEPISPANLLGFFREAAGGTREALMVGETWEEIIRRLDLHGVEDKLGNFNLKVPLTKSQIQSISESLNCVPETSVQSCPAKDKYRSITGACNNRKNPDLGVANRAFVRWLKHEYNDGFSEPQGWTDGRQYNGFPLPKVRDVSNKIARYLEENVVLDEERSQLFMSWGQWVTHDMDFSPQGFVNCTQPPSCKNDGNNFPVLIPPNDPAGNKDRECMQFRRTAPACRSNTLVREQLNGVTSFIDASNVYGSEECQVPSLKDSKSNLGSLAVNKWRTDNGRAHLPYVNDTESQCAPGVSCAPPNPCGRFRPDLNVSCFVAGDRRVNQNLGLLAINTLFLREHNRLTKELNRINPHWDREKLFQEARKIVGAENQIIHYKQYLPLIFGERTEEELPRYDGYNEKEDPRIANVFSIAFRDLHATIPPYVYLLDSKYKPLSANYKTRFHKTLFATWMLIENGLDPIIRGMLVNDAKLLKQDKMVSDEVRDRMFATNDSVPGLDLAAFDMNRGRDHGIPRYNHWRKFCGLSQPRNLDELSDVFKNKELAKKFMALYKTTSNIDLWIGALAEPFVKKGRVGPLLSCIFGKQFRKLRDGDRFWWQNPDVFTRQQQSALNRFTFSQLFCDNSGLKEVARDVFKANDYPQDFVSCNSINKLDLSAWVEAHKGPKKERGEL